MRIAHIFSHLFESWHRHNDDDLDSWMEVWLEAFNLAYFILRDIELAKRVATESIRQLNEERPKRRHAVFNLSHYQQSVRDKKQRLAKLRKPFLPDHQYLDLLVYIFSNSSERKKTAQGNASRDDFDVWFVKCVIENSLRRGAPALRTILGVSSIVRNYDVEQETPEIWNELVRRIPRRQELWPVNSEPFHAYWLVLRRDLKERFGSLIRRDSKGNLVRRGEGEQPDELARSCFDWFKLRESQDQCLSSDIKKAGNDNTAELMRVHAALHLECYANLIKSTNPRLSTRNFAFPEYNMKPHSSNGNKNDRTPPKLSDQELDEVRGELKTYFNKRKVTPVVSLVVTADGEEVHELSADTNCKHTVKFMVPDCVRLIQVWARQAGSAEKILLTGCPLAAFVAQRTIFLEQRQKISFNIQYVENEMGIGSYEVDVSYKGNVGQQIREGLQSITARYSTLGLRHALVRTLQYGALGLVAGALLFIMVTLVKRILTPSRSNSSSGIAVVQNQNSSVNNTIASAGHEKTDTNLTSQDATNIQNNSGQTQHDSSQKSVEHSRRRLLLNAKSALPLAPIESRRIMNSNTGASTVKELPSLADMNKIYVSDTNIYPGSDLNQQARESQMIALSRSNLFSVTEDKAKAQVMLQIVTDYRGARKQYARALLFTKKKVVLWQSSLVEISAGQISDTTRAEIDNLVQTVSQELIKAKTDDSVGAQSPMNSQ